MLVALEVKERWQTVLAECLDELEHAWIVDFGTVEMMVPDHPIEVKLRRNPMDFCHSGGCAVLRLHSSNGHRKPIAM
jgi:hypothetical protein